MSLPYSWFQSEPTPICGVLGPVLESDPRQISLGPCSCLSLTLLKNCLFLAKAIPPLSMSCFPSWLQLLSFLPALFSFPVSCRQLSVFLLKSLHGSFQPGVGIKAPAVHTRHPTNDLSIRGIQGVFAYQLINYILIIGILINRLEVKYRELLTAEVYRTSLPLSQANSTCPHKTFISGGLRIVTLPD